jgi:hypothetical protein
MSQSLILVDADTGDELLHFVRRWRRRIDAIPLRIHRHYLFLRDTSTKRFIKMLHFMELRVYCVVEYSEETAPRRNPLYVDAVAKTLLSPNVMVQEGKCEVELHEDFGWKLEKALRAEVKRLFGGVAAYELLDLAGVEFGSVPSVTEEAKDHRYAWVVVWKHHKTDEPRSERGTDIF